MHEAWRMSHGKKISVWMRPISHKKLSIKYEWNAIVTDQTLSAINGSDDDDDDVMCLNVRYKRQ